MISVKFKLKSANSQRPTSIRLFVYDKRFTGGRFVWGTGDNIFPYLWDGDTFRPTTNKRLITKAAKVNPSVKLELQNISTRLQKTTAETIKRIAYLEMQGQPVTNDNLKTYLDKTLKGIEPKPSEAILLLVDYINKFIDDLETGKRLTPRKTKYTKGSIKSWYGFLAQIQNYQKARHKRLDFNDITMDFYNDFLAFFIEKEYRANTIGRHVKTLKTIMSAALDEKLHNNREFQRKAFKTIRVDVFNIYLTQHEVNKIAALDLSNNLTDEKLRDVFLVGCYTSQRYSDYSRINEKMIRTTDAGNKVIELTQQKTKVRVLIPIKPELETILKKYNYNLPKTVEQTVNKRIKQLGKKVGITQTISYTETIGATSVKREDEKFKLITSHTARRTGITLMSKARISNGEIMKVSGHQTEKQLLNYIKTSAEEAADRLATHTHFSKTSNNLKIA